MNLPWKDKFGSFANGRQSELASKWQALPPRDKLALTVLAVFLFVFIGLYGGWELHNKANKQQLNFDKKVTDLFWLRSQAGNLKEQNIQGSESQNLQHQITKTIQQVGITSPTVIQNENKVEFAFGHTSQATINNALNQLQNQGYHIDSLNIHQEQSHGLYMIKVQGVIAIS